MASSHELSGCTDQVIDSAVSAATAANSASVTPPQARPEPTLQQHERRERSRDREQARSASTCWARDRCRRWRRTPRATARRRGRARTAMSGVARPVPHARGVCRPGVSGRGALRRRDERRHARETSNGGIGSRTLHAARTSAQGDLLRSQLPPTGGLALSGRSQPDAPKRGNLGAGGRPQRHRRRGSRPHAPLRRGRDRGRRAARRLARRRARRSSSP